VAVVRWSNRAAENFIATLERLEVTNPGAARTLARRVQRAIEQIELFPLSGQPYSELRDESVREIRIGNFRLIYLVFSDSEIDVIAFRSVWA